MRASQLAALLSLLPVGCTAAPTQPQPADFPAPSAITGSLALAPGCRANAPFHPGEPSLAADPSNHRLVITAWQQLGSPLGAGNAVAVSNDGGGHWASSLLPGLTACSGGSYVSATDPWVSIGPDHSVYVASLVTRAVADGAVVHDIIVSVSRDGGGSWRLPVVVESQPAPPTLPDKEMILADPGRPGSAYLVWVEYKDSTANSSADQVFFSRTADAGATWSAPSEIYDGGDEAQQNQLLMTADGTLLDVFVEGSSLPGTPHPPTLPVSIRVMRSRDQGATWSSPVEAVRFSYTNAVDPGTGGQLRLFGQDITAAAAGNALYVSWFVNYPGRESSIWVARSEDRGLHWSPAHAVVREKPEAFLPTLAVAGDATAGLLWFDFRKFTAGSSSLDTDVWFSTSKDRGSHWATRHVSGSFDLRSAPKARYGPFIGDYMGLVGLPDGFAAVFVQAKPLARNGPTDIFFLKIPG